jgi:nucleotide-binding universal stress UspA family protein
MRTWSITDDSIQDYPIISEVELKGKLEHEEENGMKIINKSTQILDSHQRPSKCIILRGDAATEIIAFSTEHKIDLIIAGSRGLSQMRGWLLGSVSRKLVHYAPCSVLVVKNPSKSPTI